MSKTDGNSEDRAACVVSWVIGEKRQLDFRDAKWHVVRRAQTKTDSKTECVFRRSVSFICFVCPRRTAS